MVNWNCAAIIDDTLLIIDARKVEVHGDFVLQNGQQWQHSSLRICLDFGQLFLICVMVE